MAVARRFTKQLMAS